MNPKPPPGFRTTLRQAVGLLLLALAPAAIAAFYHPKRPDFANAVAEGEITAAAASQRPADFLWIDARPAVQYAVRHVPGALPLTEDAWDDQLPAVLQAWQDGMPALVYCDSRQCEASEAVARRLREFDLAPVFVLKGGWEAWLAAQDK